MTAYSEQSPTGHAWIGDLPRHWRLAKLKQAALRIESGGTPDTGAPEYWSDDEEGGIPWVSIGDMSNRTCVDTTERRLSTRGVAVKGLRVFPAGTLLFSMYASLGHSAILMRPAAINQAILAIEPGNDLLQGFLRRWLEFVRPQLVQFASSNTQDNLNAEKVRALPVAIPTIEEQAAIAAFLDRETGKIDALVAEQERLIALLKEKRQALISHAVTKGLDPNVPMKDSGVEWLGQVPAHWRVAPIRKFAKLESGHTPSRAVPSYWDACTIPWFTLGDVWQIREDKADYVVDTKEKISELGMANSAARVLPAGTVLLSRTASVGFSAIMGIPMATTQDFANWVCGPELEPEFLLLVLRSMRQEFSRLMMGSTHNTIYMPDIQGFRIALPSVDEQRRVVEFANATTGRLERMVDECRQAAVLLAERRSVLISAAVTGKIDVRGVA